MFPVLEVRQIKVYSPMTGKIELIIKNVCLSKDDKEIVTHWDGYYYLNKNNMISKRRYKY